LRATASAGCGRSRTPRLSGRRRSSGRRRNGGPGCCAARRPDACWGDGGRRAAAARLPSRSRSAWCPVRDRPACRRPPLSQGGLADW